MEALKKYPFFTAVIAVMLLCAIAFGVLYALNLRAISERETRLNNEINQYRSLANQPLAPNTVNVENMQEFLESLRGQFGDLQTSLLRADLSEALFAGVPESGERFALSHLAFREELRRRAEERTREDGEVVRAVVIPDAQVNFGFQRYPGTAPAADLIRPLYEQRQILQLLLTELIDVRPQSILSVRRGPVPGELPTRARETGRGRAAAFGDEDSERDPTERDLTAFPGLFIINRDISARVPGIVDTIPVQIGFRGQSYQLREWLNNIAESGYPIAVRNIEVRPAREARGPRQVQVPTGTGTPASRAETARREAARTGRRAPTGFVEVIGENFSEFLVTFEYLLPVREASVVEASESF